MFYEDTCLTFARLNAECTAAVCWFSSVEVPHCIIVCYLPSSCTILNMRIVCIGNKRCSKLWLLFRRNFARSKGDFAALCWFASMRVPHLNIVCYMYHLHVHCTCTLQLWTWVDKNMAWIPVSWRNIWEKYLRQPVQTLLVARLCNQMLTCFDGSATLNHSNQYLPVLTSSGYECLQLHIF